MEIKKKIIKIMSGSYEPTLADSIRIYREYCINKGEVSAILSGVYKWLAQKPFKRDYKAGVIYARCECDVEEILCIHYIYINKKENIVIDDKFSYVDNEITEISLEEYIQFIKQCIKEQLSQK